MGIKFKWKFSIGNILLKQNICYSVLLVVLFVNMYPVVLKGIPFSLARVSQLIGLSISFYLFYIKKKTKINVYLLKVIVLYFLLSFISIIALLRSGYFEFSFFKEVFSPILFVSSSFFLYKLVCILNLNITQTKLIELVIICGVMQSVVSLIMFFDNDLYNTIMSYIVLDKDLSERVGLVEYRLMGIGNSVWLAGFNYGINLFMLITLPYLNDSKIYKYKLIYILFILLIIVAGILSARTFFVSIFIGVVYLIWLNKDKLMLLISKSVKVLIYIIILSLILYNTIDLKYTERFDKIFNWAFEFIINYINNGTIETTSTNHMFKDMYIFPHNIVTWLIGDGFFMDPSGIYYKGTDIGYIRVLFYFGMIGLILYYFSMFYFVHVVKYYYHNKYIKYLIVFILIQTIVMNFKGYINADFYLGLFFVFGIFKFDFQRITNNKLQE